MSPTPIQEETLFADALARPPAERPGFLARACAGDAALRERVAALLAAHETPDSLLCVPAPARGISPEEKPGDHIGHYKLLQKIGEGGCGVVWMAEQEEPVRRRVALKVIKLGMDTKAVVARFEAERQALAMMDHPNIAKVHDAGSTVAGRPYFVMELIRGIPITRYCDENHLTPPERLELFIKVCQAIQHAHQKGVIHRDIKPSNILVTVNDGQPTPKVIDFGIAKATQGKLTDATVFTAFEQFIGTPVYMSPEQAEMSSLDIDTRSDIYSLGVLLYELLAGRPPFDPKAFASAGVDEIRKQIREVDPAKPSARLRTLTNEEQTTIARLRGTAPSELSVVLRGDLDWIIMRCLEKDRTRRYDTATGLVMDIQRYLRHEPITAHPPSTAYLLRKVIRRHRLGFTVAAFTGITLIVGLTLSTYGLIREKIARERAVAAEHKVVGLEAMADKARGQAEKLVGFLLDDFYSELEPTGRLETVAKLASEAVAYFDGLPDELRSAATQRSRAVALLRLGESLNRSGKFTEGAAILDAALAEFERLHTRDDRSDAVVVGLAAALRSRAQLDDAIDRPPARLALSRSVGLLRPLKNRADFPISARIELAEALRSLATSLKPSRESLTLLEEARDALTAPGVPQEGHTGVSSSLANVLLEMARLNRILGQSQTANFIHEEVVTITEKVLDNQPGNLRALSIRAKVDYDSAFANQRNDREGAWRRALAAQERFDQVSRLNPSHAEVWADAIRARQLLAALSRDEGKIERALHYVRSAFDTAKAHKSNAKILSGLPDAARQIAQYEAWRGNRVAAFEMLNESARLRDAYYVERGVSASVASEIAKIDHEGYVRRVRFHLTDYAAVCADAERALEWIEAVERRPQISDRDRSVLRRLRVEALGDLGRGHAMLGRWAEAEAALCRAVDIVPRTDTNWAWLAIARGKQGRSAEALEAVGKSELRENRQRYADGDRTLFTIWHLARAVLGEALAQPPDAAGCERRSVLLKEASHALEALSPEAKSLMEIGELRRMIDTERANIE